MSYIKYQETRFASRLQIRGSSVNRPKLMSLNSRNNNCFFSEDMKRICFRSPFQQNTQVYNPEDLYRPYVVDEKHDKGSLMLFTGTLKYKYLLECYLNGLLTY
ncbi:hypothetical protein RF11_12876 [Thelohanellus kitauei]|uniref:Uncharacterized protein n=1 Tax=Thelohanellus kitauei TaxID=669202 RepID=A0A0C2MIH6_THEKT|nr:hypothetical protein RF11_12876 [Thelohanellus kitauei]